MELRCRFESDTLFRHHLVSTISKWSGRFLSAQRARLINFGQFINEDLIDDINNVHLGITYLYEVPQNPEENTINNLS